MGPPSCEVVVASFNVHAGVDGWGRPFDVVEACRSLSADVVVLQEAWSSPGGDDMAAGVAAALGFSTVFRPLAGGRRALPAPSADRRWKPARSWRGAHHAIYLDSERPLPRSVTGSARYREAVPGRWGICVLSRHPLHDVTGIDLGRLPGDRVRRAVIVGRYEVGGRRLVVAGTHMSHLFFGSPAHFLRLRQVLGDLAGDDPAVLLGDMNLWGPAVAAFTGWRRAVRGRTWPAWRPHSQIDHILVNGSVHTSEGRVCRVGRSDHLAVSARLTLAGP
ncbi:MAG TPA: endonuclease/exonuclease/phosphatase family protein [Acidimicrobiales bacterium]|nr:endonuclease/exonuclease/phosphatase family protein [Acidimicrobiales bacterium]